MRCSDKKIKEIPWQLYLGTESFHILSCFSSPEKEVMLVRGKSINKTNKKKNLLLLLYFKNHQRKYMVPAVVKNLVGVLCLPRDVNIALFVLKYLKIIAIYVYMLFSQLNRSLKVNDCSILVAPVQWNFFLTNQYHRMSLRVVNYIGNIWKEKKKEKPTHDVLILGCAKEIVIMKSFSSSFYSCSFQRISS